MSMSIRRPIKQNKLHLFKPASNSASKTKMKMAELKDDVSVCGQLYVSLQNPSGDMAQFFVHESKSYPPSLSDHRKISFTAKSNLFECLSKGEDEEPPIAYECQIIDGAVLIHALPRTTVSTFQEYATKIFIPYLCQQLRTSRRLGICTYRTA